MDGDRIAGDTFRRESGRILAALIRMSGSFDLAEEALQDAFAAALTAWRERGIPDNPGAWIMAAARRKILDSFRRSCTRQDNEAALRYESKTLTEPEDFLMEADFHLLSSCLESGEPGRSDYAYSGWVDDGRDCKGIPCAGSNTCSTPGTRKTQDSGSANSLSNSQTGTAW